MFHDAVREATHLGKQNFRWGDRQKLAEGGDYEEVAEVEIVRSGLVLAFHCQ
jgi:hypothetical protein